MRISASKSDGHQPEMGGLPTLGWVDEPSGGVQASLGLIHKRGENGAER